MFLRDNKRRTDRAVSVFGLVVTYSSNWVGVSLYGTRGGGHCMAPPRMMPYCMGWVSLPAWSLPVWCSIVWRGVTLWRPHREWEVTVWSPRPLYREWGSLHGEGEIRSLYGATCTDPHCMEGVTLWSPPRMVPHRPNGSPPPLFTDAVAKI